MSNVNLTQKQRSALMFLSYKYGNGGSLSSADNHKFIQFHLAGMPNSASGLLHRITPDCLAAFNRIMADDYHELHKSQRVIVEAAGKGFV